MLCGYACPVFSLRAAMLPSVSLLDSFQTSSFTVMLVIYLVAIAAEAMSGALAAGRRNMDIFGVVVIAFVTALGGGTIRDMVLGHYPIGWTQHPEYVYLVISFGLLTTVIARHMHRLKQVFLFLDAMGCTCSRDHPRPAETQLLTSVRSSNRAKVKQGGAIYFFIDLQKTGPASRFFVLSDFAVSSRQSILPPCGVEQNPSPLSSRKSPALGGVIARHPGRNRSHLV